MATVNYYLDTRSVRKDGTSPLKLSINSKGKSCLVSLGVYLVPSQWDRVRQKVIGHPRRAYLNSFLLQRRLDAEQVILELRKDSHVAFSIQEVKRRLVALGDGSASTQPFFEYFLKCAGNPELRPATRNHYRFGMNKIRRFMADEGLGEPESLRFEDINHDWLSAFDEWLATHGTPGQNSRGVYLGVIRAVFSYALDDEVTTCFPFRKFKIKRVPTKKRALPVEDLRKLFISELADPRLEKYRDAFLFMFCLCGLNVSDMFDLKMSDISPQGRLEYYRNKTMHFYSLRVEPEAMAIIKKYHPAGSPFVFRLHDHYPHVGNYTWRLNKMLKRLRGKDGVRWFPFLSSYYARHSWASIAAELDVPKETIGAALGHGWTTVTDTYIDFNLRKVDEANRRVLDWVLYGKR